MSNKYAVYPWLLMALLSAPAFARAATATTSIPVSASVSQSCSISTSTGLAFAAYDPIGTNATAALNATGQISVACSKGATGLTIGMDNGAHASGAQRQMLGTTATALLSYNVFQPPSNVPGVACTFPGTLPWTAATGGMLTLTSAPAKAARLYNVCGTVPGGQDVGADTYGDVLGATLNF